MLIFVPEKLLNELHTSPYFKVFRTVSSPFQVYKKVHVEFIIAGEEIKHEFYVYNEITPIFGRHILRRLLLVLDLHFGQLIPKTSQWQPLKIMITFILVSL